MPISNAIYQVTIANTEPHGPMHEPDVLLKLLRIANEANQAARNHAELRPELEAIAATAAKQAVVVARTALR